MLAAILLFIVAVEKMIAGTTGKIAGMVKDQTSGLAIPLCKIVVEGTTLNAVTDAKGHYFILNVPPGIYTVVASAPEYAETKMANVNVNMNLTATIDFALAARETAGGKAERVAARLLIQRDGVAALQIIDAELIENMVADNFKDALTLNSSVTTAQIRQNGARSNSASGEGLFFVRGGRGNELALIVDGVAVRDAITAGLGTEVANNAIAEIQLLPGNFSAEYGNALSGVVNLATADGNKTSFKLSGFTDALFGAATHDYTFKQRGQLIQKNGKLDRANWGTYQGQFSFGGALPGDRDQVRYFAAGDYFETDGYIGVLQDEFARRGTAKLSFSPSSQAKFTLTANAYSKDQEIYEHAFAHQGLYFQRVDGDTLDNNFAGNDRLSTRTYQGLAAWTQALSARAFFDFRLQYFTRRFFDRVRNDPSAYRLLFFNDSEDFAIAGDDPRFLKQEDRVWQGKLDWTCQANRHHELKAGVDLAQRRIWRKRLLLTGDIANLTVDQVTFKPIEAAAYVQDKIESNDFVINAGLRMDYFDPSDVLALADSEFLPPPRPAKIKPRFSPRLGLAYLLNERAKVHFAAGRFYQFLPTLGNIDIEPPKAASFETGWEQQLTDFLSLSVAGFYKDFERIFSSLVFLSPGNNTNTYVVNQIAGNSRGVELTLRLRRHRHVAAYFNYTLSRAELDRLDPLNRPPLSPAINEVIVDWDRPHVFNFNLDYRYNKNESPSWLQNFGANLTGRFANGLPYTPRDSRGQPIAKENSARRPATWQLDLRAEKSFAVDNIQFGVFTEILNLTNRRNIIDVFADSGLPDNSTDPGYSPEGERNPYNIGPQRNIRLGVEVSR